MAGSVTNQPYPQAFHSNPGVKKKRIKTLKALAGNQGFRLVPNQYQYLIFGTVPIDYELIPMLDIWD